MKTHKSPRLTKDNNWKVFSRCLDFRRDPKTREMEAKFSYPPAFRAFDLKQAFEEVGW